MDKVSYIVPCYNAAEFVKRAIDSLLNQTHANKEIIAIDDGSTDNTAEILASYGDQIRVIKTHHTGKMQGAATARNVGLWESTGDYIQCLDVDDWYEPHNTETLLKLLQETNSDLVWGKGIRHLPDGTTEENIGSQNSPEPGIDPFIFFLRTNPHTNAFLYKREILREVGGFRAGVPAEEVDLFVRLGALRPKIAKSEEILFHINIHEGEFRVGNNNTSPGGFFAMMMLSNAFLLDSQRMLDTPERRAEICRVLKWQGRYSSREQQAKQMELFTSVYVSEMKNPEKISWLKRIRHLILKVIYRK